MNTIKKVKKQIRQYERLRDHTMQLLKDGRQRVTNGDRFAIHDRERHLIELENINNKLFHLNEKLEIAEIMGE